MEYLVAQSGLWSVHGTNDVYSFWRCVRRASVRTRGAGAHRPQSSAKLMRGVAKSTAVTLSPSRTWQVSKAMGLEKGEVAAGDSMYTESQEGRGQVGTAQSGARKQCTEGVQWRGSAHIP